MRGTQHIEVSNRYVRYKFDLYRNITIVRGDSGTGKTTLFNLIADHTREREKSGVNLSSTAPCAALTDSDWQNQLRSIHESIVFVDEDSKYISSIEFSRAVKESDNYYVIFNREGLHNLPYSVNEIYEIKTSGKYHSFKKNYVLTEKNEYRRRGKKESFSAAGILTEDSKSGYQFFDAIAKDHAIDCDTSGSNSAVLSWLTNHRNEKVIVICDGAAFGAEIDRVSKLIEQTDNVRLLLPESFEWMILRSGLIEGVESILKAPYEHIESAEYFSWENYFEALLIDRTEDTHWVYSKSNLNEFYLSDSAKKAILQALPDLF